jgi:hypothetical protein
MIAREIIGLLGIVFGLFLFGMFMNMNYISLLILLALGGIFFFAVYLKNAYATIGLVVLAFALILYLFSPSGIEGLPIENETGTTNFTAPTVTYNFPDYYIPTIVLLLVVIVGFVMAYKASN